MPEKYSASGLVLLETHPINLFNFNSDTYFRKFHHYITSWYKCSWWINKSWSCLAHPLCAQSKLGTSNAPRRRYPQGNLFKTSAGGWTWEVEIAWAWHQSPLSDFSFAESLPSHLQSDNNNIALGATKEPQLNVHPILHTGVALKISPLQITC